MDPLQLLINTQTPLLQFRPRTDPSDPPWEEETDLSDLDPKSDYRLSPGGVTRMVYPLIRRLLAERVCSGADWVALNPNAPSVVRLSGLTLHNLSLDKERLGAYGRVKEAMWSQIHGLDAPANASELFWSEEYGEYAYYNRTTAELIRDLDRESDFDAFYIHDFQQLSVGHMLDTVKPKMFRWHIPFEVSSIPEEWRAAFATYLDSYDVAVVSTDRWKTALRRFGHQGRVVRIYPYVDPAEYRRPPDTEVEAVAEKFGIPREAPVVLVVARMDPAKGQDRAIRAMARLRTSAPEARLVLAGNGSFSGSAGGLGLSKSDRWRAHLESTARDLGVADRVVFTGHVTQDELDSLYERATFTVLPSTNEGFGLVVVESWLHGKPTVITRRAGIAELVDDGENGLLFDPDHEEELVDQMRRLLRDRDGESTRLGAAGLSTAPLCSLDAAVRAERELLALAVEA